VIPPVRLGQCDDAGLLNRNLSAVLAGLVPATHALNVAQAFQGVDARDERGHDRREPCPVRAAYGLNEAGRSTPELEARSETA
jgi:hypothetical protein